jgi:hypothetical protein
MKNQKQNQDSDLSQEEMNYEQQLLLSEHHPTLLKKINTGRNPSNANGTYTQQQPTQHPKKNHNSH